MQPVWSVHSTADSLGCRQNLIRKEKGDKPQQTERRFPIKAKLPGQYVARFNTVVTEPSAKQARGVDGRPSHEWFEADSINQSVTYNGSLQRLDSRYTLEMSWVDLDNTGHRIVLPHKVVEAIRSAIERIIDQSNSDGARKAAMTRKEAGVVPFQPKSSEAS